MNVNNKRERETVIDLSDDEKSMGSQPTVSKKQKKSKSVVFPKEILMSFLDEMDEYDEDWDEKTIDLITKIAEGDINIKKVKIYYD